MRSDCIGNPHVLQFKTVLIFQSLLIILARYKLTGLISIHTYSSDGEIRMTVFFFQPRLSWIPVPNLAGRNRVRVQGKSMYSLSSFCILYEDSLVKSIKIDIDDRKELKFTIKFRKPPFAPELFAGSLRQKHEKDLINWNVLASRSQLGQCANKRRSA